MNFIKTVQFQITLITLILFACLSTSLLDAQIRKNKVFVEPRSKFDELTNNPVRSLFIEGEIDEDLVRQVDIVFKSHPNAAWTVSLHSPGGQVLAGMELGRLFRANAVSTYIARYSGSGEKANLTGVCLSSCSLAFLGGVYRHTNKDSVYGVHRFSMSGGTTAEDLDIAQIVLAEIAQYLKEMGIDSGLLKRMTAAGKDEMYVLKDDEIKDLGVANKGRTEAKWSVEVTEGGFYLKGVQSTVFGEGKSIFTCDKQTLWLTSFYQTGAERAKEIISNFKYHSLMIDTKVFPLVIDRFEVANSYIVGGYPIPRHLALNISTADQVGIAMRMGEDAPTFVGYRIDIPLESRLMVQNYFRNCKVK